MSRALRVEPVSAEHEPALLDLFARTGTACHCQYWHFDGDKNAWLHRLAYEPEENRAALSASLRAGSAEGVVALSAERVVGWLKLARAEALPKLYEQRLYRGLPCFAGDRTGVLTIGCLLVDEDERRRGVSRALIRGAVEIARSRGARAVEAFPRGRQQAPEAHEPHQSEERTVADGELWLGPLSVFLDAGFRVVNDFRPYPVLRHDLTSALASDTHA